MKSTPNARSQVSIALAARPRASQTHRQIVAQEQGKKRVAAHADQLKRMAALVEEKNKKVKSNCFPAPSSQTASAVPHSATTSRQLNLRSASGETKFQGDSTSIQMGHAVPNSAAATKKVKSQKNQANTPKKTALPPMPETELLAISSANAINPASNTTLKLTLTGTATASANVARHQPPALPATRSTLATVPSQALKTKANVVYTNNDPYKTGVGPIGPTTRLAKYLFHSVLSTTPNDAIAPISSRIATRYSSTSAGSAGSGGASDSTWTPEQRARYAGDKSESFVRGMQSSAAASAQTHSEPVLEPSHSIIINQDDQKVQAQNAIRTSSPMTVEVQRIASGIDTLRDKFFTDYIAPFYEANDGNSVQPVWVSAEEFATEKRRETFFDMARIAIKQSNAEWLSVLLGPNLFLSQQQYNQELLTRHWQTLPYKHAADFYKKLHELLNELLHSYMLSTHNAYRLISLKDRLNPTFHLVKHAKKKLEQRRMELHKQEGRILEEIARQDAPSSATETKNEKANTVQLLKAQLDQLHLQEQQLKLPKQVSDLPDIWEFFRKLHQTALQEEKQLNGNYYRRMQAGYSIELVSYPNIPEDNQIKPYVMYVYVYPVVSLSDEKNILHEFIAFKAINAFNKLETIKIGDHQSLPLIMSALKSNQPLATGQIEVIFDEAVKFGYVSKNQGYQGYLQEFANDKSSRPSSRNEFTGSAKMRQAFIDRIKLEIDELIGKLMKEITDHLDASSNNDQNPMQMAFRIVKDRRINPYLIRHAMFLQTLMDEFQQHPFFDEFLKEGSYANAKQFIALLKKSWQELESKYQVLRQQNENSENKMAAANDKKIQAFRQTAAVWLQRKYRDLPPAYTKDMKIDALVDETIHYASKNEALALSECIRRQRKLAYKKDAEGNSLLHYAVTEYAKRVVKLAVCDSNDAQLLEQRKQLLRIIELLQTHGCCLDWKNNAGKMVSEAYCDQAKQTWVDVTGEPSAEGAEQYTLLDWAMLRISLEHFVPFSHLSRSIKKAVIENGDRISKNLNSWFTPLWRLVNSATVEQDFLEDASLYVASLYEGQRQHSDSITHEAFIEREKNAEHKSKLSAPMTEVYQKARPVVFNTSSATIARDKQLTIEKLNQKLQKEKAAMQQQYDLERQQRLEEQKREKETQEKLRADLIIARAGNEKEKLAIVQTEETEKKKELAIVQAEEAKNDLAIAKAEIAELRRQLAEKNSSKSPLINSGNVTVVVTPVTSIAVPDQKTNVVPQQSNTIGPSPAQTVTTAVDASFTAQGLGLFAKNSNASPTNAGTEPSTGAYNTMSPHD